MSFLIFQYTHEPFLRCVQIQYMYSGISRAYTLSSMPLLGITQWIFFHNKAISYGESQRRGRGVALIWNKPKQEWNRNIFFFCHLHNAQASYQCKLSFYSVSFDSFDKLDKLVRLSGRDIPLRLVFMAFRISERAVYILRGGGDGVVNHCSNFMQYRGSWILMLLRFRLRFFGCLTLVLYRNSKSIY